MSEVPHGRREQPNLERGACVARYVVMGPLGEGGMGMVYKAYDPQLDRAVAIKLLRADSGTAALLRDRLLREAQALAQLSHPNVIAVHDVGEHGAHVFIAMEFIDGVTLRGWLGETPRTQRQILDVFLAAGEGLTAAHRAGLVHRDFKPDNVMVGVDGRVRVLDFGLVRAAGMEPHAAERGPAPPPVVLTTPTTHSTPLSTPLTHAGSVMGTPRFMAPEQHLATEVDERADQFSFCVSLYEALYGELPFADRQAVLDGRISDPPASTSVPRWLRQVLARGLAFAPAARHPSMAALLAALRDDPSVARRRWLRIAAVVLCAGLLVGWRVVQSRGARACLGGAAKLAGTWDDARRQAVGVAFRASGRPYAEAVLRTVLHQLDEYGRKWAAMHADACESSVVRHEQSQELLDLRMSCLSDRLMNLKSLSDLYATADGEVVDRAAQSVESLPALERCADVSALRAPVPPPADAHAQHEVAEVRRQLAQAHALRAAGKYADGAALARAAATSAQALHYRPIEAEAQLQLGDLLEQQGEPTEAAAATHRALVAAMAGRHDEVLANAAIDLVHITGPRLNHYDEAHRWAELAEAAIGRLSARDDLLGDFYIGRSVLYRCEDKIDEALADAQRGLALQQRRYGADDLRLARSYHSLADIYFLKASYPQALELYQRELALRERTEGPEHPEVAPVRICIANIYGNNGQHERSIAEYERAVRIYQRTNPQHPTVAVAYNNMGEDLQALGRFAEALEKFQRALAIEQRINSASEGVLVAQINIAEVELALDHLAPAQHRLEEAVAMAVRVVGTTHEVYARALTQLGEALRRQGRLDEALVHSRHAIAVFEKALGPDHRELAPMLLRLGRIHLDRHEVAQSIPAFERAVTLCEADAADAAALAEARFTLAGARWAAGDHTRATALAQQALEGYTAAGQPGRADAARVTAWLAQHR